MSDEHEKHAALLVPVDERLIDFYGDEIVAVLVRVNDQLAVYVPLRPLCRYLGLAWTGQHDRIRRDIVLSEALKTVRVTRTVSQESKRGDADFLCLPLEYIPGWLFGINANRVKPELQAKIIRYQRECFRILWEAFQPQMIQQQPTSDATPEGANIQELQRIVEMSEAMARMARQQIDMQRQQAHLTRRLDKAKHVVKAIQDDVAGVQQEVADIQIRLGSVEEHLHPHTSITNEQAATISNAVKALAASLSETEPGKNHYQGIFSELYRRFSVSSYKLIRQEQYAEVLTFLEEWRAGQAQ